MDETTTLTDVATATLETVEAAVARVVRVFARPLDVVARAVADEQASVVRLARPPCGRLGVIGRPLRPASCRASCVQEA